MSALWNRTKEAYYWIMEEATNLLNHRFLQRGKKLSRSFMLYAFLIDGAFVFLLPIIYMGIISIFTREDLLDPSIRWIPAHFLWQNYVEAFTRLNFIPSLMHTLIATTVAIVGQLFFCSFAGYALARLNFKGSRWVLAAVLLVLIIPAQAMTLPNFVFFARIHWTGTMLPITIPELLGNGLYGALFVFIFRQVFSSFPKDLEDAAAIDGAGMFRTFFEIVAPLAKTAYATVGLFSFVWHWNEYMRPMMYLKENNRTLTVALSLLFNGGGVSNISDAVKGAAVVLVMAPVMLFYFFVQKYFVQGVQMTGIKG